MPHKARNIKADIFALAVERALPYPMRQQAYAHLPDSTEAEFHIRVALAGRLTRGRPKLARPDTPLFSAQIVAELAALLDVPPDVLVETLATVWARRTNSRRALDPKDVAEGAEEHTALTRVARDAKLKKLAGHYLPDKVQVAGNYETLHSEITLA
ncbi:MAG: hypothetical protein AAGF84_10815 [Planctomycetota bacterium]